MANETILCRVEGGYLMSFNWREINHHYLLLQDILRGEAAIMPGH